MKAVLVILALVCLAAAISQEKGTRKSFSDFKRKFNKNYASVEEHERRFQNFKASIKRAARTQALNKGSATFGVTKFSDLSKEEFASLYLMKDFQKNFPGLPPAKNFSIPTKPSKFKADPTNWDWFSQGVCTQIYDQGQCGSCWAFSATETIESYFAIGGGQLTELSMQQIVDCDTSGQDQGCNGGFPSSAYQYVQGAGGLDSLASYPYTAADGTCQDNPSAAVANVASQQSLGGESGLYSQLSSAGPVSVCVDASSWQDYNGGVLTSCGTSVDHCVQATGYANYNSGNSYWVVRNSWGADWGQSGFIWIQTGQDLCAIGDYCTIVSAVSGK